MAFMVVCLLLTESLSECIRRRSRFCFFRYRKQISVSYFWGCVSKLYGLKSATI